jgi:hypothetical protein
MSTLVERLSERLASTSVNAERFRQLVGRLYASGVLSRSWSDEEGRLYDDAARIEEVLADYFELGGFRLFHDREARVLRLFPPGGAAAEPGEPDEDITRRLRSRVPRELAAMLLALRFLYAKGVQEGVVNNQDEVPVTLEELSQAMVTTLGQQLPRTASERATHFREARKLRVLRLPDEDRLTSPDSFLGIQRAILSLIPDTVFEAILAAHPGELEVAEPAATVDDAEDSQ